MGKLGNSVKNISPEYEDCRKIASQRAIPLKEVCDEASRVAKEMIHGGMKPTEKGEGSS